MKSVVRPFICLWFIMIVFLLPQKAASQTDKWGGWYIANLNYTLSKKVSLYAEMQTRSQKLTDDFYYHEEKGGLVYSLPNRNSFMVAIGNYDTYPFPGNYKSPASFKEFRTWEQFVLNNNIDRLKIEHRYRIEQRWLNGDYRNRFRYRLNPVVPINHATVRAGTLFLTAFDEVFFTSKAPYFERNRFFAGAGFSFSPHVTLQLGYIRQFDYRTSDNGAGKNFVQTSLLFSAGQQNANREHHPSTMD